MKLNNGAELVACVISPDNCTAGVLAVYLGNYVVWAAYKTSEGWECHSGEYYHCNSGKPASADQMIRNIATQRFIDRFHGVEA